MAGYYGLEGAAVVTVDRAVKSNDVIVIKGKTDSNGVQHPNRAYTRRDRWNPMFGPSVDLSKNGVGWLEYTETNDALQIYDNVGVAVYGKYDFIMSPDVERVWKDFEKSWKSKYQNKKDYDDYAVYLSSIATQREATSEWKQQRYRFNHRNEKPAEHEFGIHDYMTEKDLMKAGFKLVKYSDENNQPTIADWKQSNEKKAKQLKQK